MAHYDCSHPIDADMPVYPGSRPVGVEAVTSLPEDGSRVTELDLDAHVGTHVDAPAHTLADGRTLAEFDVSEFTFCVRLVECTDVSAREGIERAALGDPSAHDMLVVRTGWDRHWGSERYRDHPYLTVDAARWCAENGYSVGLDTFGPDPTPSADAEREREDEPDGLPAHDALFAADSLVVENLRGLGQLPPEFELTALPLALDAEASPVRAVAQV